MSTAAPPPPDSPQVLLFGHTGAGKSSVLGALLRSAETQGSTLRGEVLEASGRMASIRDSIYRGDSPARSDAELTRYVVRVRPWRDGAGVLADPVTVVVNDCSGKAAESLIHHPDPLHDPRTKAPVARAVIEADAIVLMVDAAADDDELQEAFEEFDAFLTVVSHGKADAREVGGFPVLLVLTQCDRLARPGDSLAEWEGRVQTRAERAWAKFDAFLKDAEAEDGIPSPFLPFGGVELNVYAVAIRHPKLADVPAQPQVPYRIAELFRDCFEAARSHRERVTASNRRLKWTVRFSLSLVTLLFAGVLLMALYPPKQSDPGLAERVAGYRQNEPEAAERLAYPYLTRNKQTLTGFRDAAGFDAIAPELQAFVLSRLKEIDDYEDYRKKLLAARAPGDVRTLEDLAKVEESLRGELGLPDQYGWGGTFAAKLRDKWLADAAAIRAAEERFGVGYTEPDPKDPKKLVPVRGYYQRLVSDGLNLMTVDSLGGAWRGRVNALLEEGSKPPAPLDGPLSGSPDRSGSNELGPDWGKPLTNRVPYNFQRVVSLRTTWEGLRNERDGTKIQPGITDQLTHLRDLADALGLTEGADRPALLVLPEPGPGVDSAKLAGQRWFALTTTYPPRTLDYREWDVAQFTGPAKVLRERLDRSFRTGTRHVLALVADRLGPEPAAKDTPDGWRALADVLGDPTTPFPEWGRLLHLLARLRDPNAPNPVGELAAFLRRDKFDLDPREFDLVIPRRLRGVDPVTPAGPLTITVTPRAGKAFTKQLKQVGEGVRGDNDTTYRFARGDEKLPYQPGDELRAELPVKAGTEELKLVWDAGGPRVFQFDRLSREPRIVKGTASEPATGVRLTPTGGSTWPRLPVLFPTLK
jgi:hypothetical protein